jgi:phage tail-like protein
MMLEPRPHFRLDASAGWRAEELKGALVSGGVLSLEPLPGTGRPLVDAAGTFGGLSEPTGIAVDRHGRVYLLGRNGCGIHRFDPCECRFDRLPGIGGKGCAPRQFCEPWGIAITPAGDLWIADSGNQRLQVFTLKGLSLRQIIGKPAAFPAEDWRPFDIAIGADCRVYVSDPLNLAVHVFDGRGRWWRAIRETEPGEPLAGPTHLTVDCSQRLYVVEENIGRVAVFAHDGTFAGRLDRPADAAGRFPSSIATDSAGTLYLNCLSPRGCCCQIYRCSPDGLPLPTSTLHAPGAITAFRLDGKALAWDGCRLIAMDPAGEFASMGLFSSQALDSRIYRCRWHRVVIEGDVPAGSSVAIETFTSEAEKSPEEIERLPDSRWRRAAIHSDPALREWDSLIRSDAGRYLWLRLRLESSGETTPRITAIRVEYPRASSLQYLPAVFQQEPESRDFLDRFLSIFDSLRDEIRRRIREIALYFDAQSVPATPDFLGWLASWIGLSFDRRWPVAKRRDLLAAAHELYRRRGTLEGVALHIELVTGVRPQILEHFRLRRLLFLGAGTLGDRAELFGPDLMDRLQVGVHSTVGEFRLVDLGDPRSDPVGMFAHRFTVYAPVSSDVTETDRLMLMRIITLSKPAHTEGFLEVVRPRFCIGIQARVGVNTVVGHYPEGVELDRTQLGAGSVLSLAETDDGPPTLKIGSRSRIGQSTLLD